MAEPVEVVDLAQVDVRTSDPSVLPFDAPEPNTAITWDGRDVLWLGPDEWLVVGEAGSEGTVVEALEELLAAHHHALVDVSANRIVFALQDSLELLSTACGLDLHPTRWTPGMCAQTLVGHAQVILHQRDRRTTRVFVRPSFSVYLAERLGIASALS
jgi:sarcosine oxidase, subunit gamma